MRSPPRRIRVIAFHVRIAGAVAAVSACVAARFRRNAIADPPIVLFVNAGESDRRGNQASLAGINARDAVVEYLPKTAGAGRKTSGPNRLAIGQALRGGIPQ